MPSGEKNDADRAGDARPTGKTVDDNETFGDALEKAGFEPARVGPKIVGQGKRREAVKKWASKDPDK